MNFFDAQSMMQIAKQQNVSFKFLSKEGTKKAMFAKKKIKLLIFRESTWWLQHCVYWRNLWHVNYIYLRCILMETNFVGWSLKVTNNQKKKQKPTFGERCTRLPVSECRFPTESKLDWLLLSIQKLLFLKYLCNQLSHEGGNARVMSQPVIDFGCF